DGTECSMLYRFNTTAGDGRSPKGGLVKGHDGGFYGTTFYGGDLAHGTVFRLLPPETPTMLGVIFMSGAAQVSFGGVSGNRYQAQRSIDLINWTLLATITMPSSGIYTNIDAMSPSPSAYYRAIWVP